MFGRENQGTVLGNNEARLTRNVCECIFYFYGEICGILENVPRFLKNAFHIREERYLGGVIRKFVENRCHFYIV